MEGEFFLQRLRISTADLTHLLLDCPASEPFRHANNFGSTSVFDLWSRPWGVAVHHQSSPSPS